MSKQDIVTDIGEEQAADTLDRPAAKEQAQQASDGEREKRARPFFKASFAFSITWRKLRHSV